MTPTMRRTFALATVFPIVVVAAATVTVLSWRSRLPDPIATHWGVHERVDGVGSLGSTIVVMAGMAIVLTGVFGAVLFHVRPADRLVRGMVTAFTVWIATFLSALLVGLTALQRGLDSAHDAGSPAWAVFWSLVLATALAVAAVFLTPADEAVRAAGRAPADAPRVEMRDGERAVWTRTAVSRSGVLIGCVTLVVGCVLAAVLWSWLPLVVATLTGVVVLSMMAWRVTVDRRGLTARAVFGLPLVTVPLRQIEAADASTVSAMGEFGGFGIRLGRKGRSGIVLRSGEALEVRRSVGRPFVVTVDDARTGAALLNALADRARESPR